MYILSDKVVITRKAHRCSACLRKFPKGTKMRTQVNTNDGLCVWRECPTCQELLSKHREHFEDDYDHIVYGGDVLESLEKGQTPEQLLRKLDEIKQSSLKI